MKLSHIFIALLTSIGNRLTMLYYYKIQAKTTNMCFPHFQRLSYIEADFWNSNLTYSYHTKNKKFT